MRRDLTGAAWKIEFKRAHFDTLPEERTLETSHLRKHHASEECCVLDRLRIRATQSSAAG